MSFMLHVVIVHVGIGGYGLICGGEGEDVVMAELVGAL